MPRYSKGEALDWARETMVGQWSTLVTPFTVDDDIDELGLRSNIRRISSLGTQGVGCTWGMGEFWSLTIDERLRVYDIVVDESGDTLFTAAHVTHTSVKDTVLLANHAENVGFDLLVIAAPYFVTKTEEQIVQYVSHVAENTSLAIMFYNSPQFGIVVSPDGLKRLCDIPNVVGVKEASFDRQLSIDVHLLIGNESVVSTPDEWILFKGKELGFQQQVMFANTSDWRFDTPECNNYVSFVNRAIQGDVDEGFYLANISPLKKISDKWWQKTVKKFNGSLPVSMCKYRGELMRMAGGHVRLPLVDLLDDEKSELKSQLSSIINVSSQK